LGLVPELVCYLLAISRALVYWPTFQRLSLAYSACPLLAGSGFLRMGPFPSDLGSLLDIGRSFELYERTNANFPRFELFSLVQFC
jgi:hypothetical protein